VPTYIRAPTGQEAASLLGLSATVGGGSSVPAGTLSLPVVTSAGWAAGPLWLLDGPTSEVVQVTGAPDATHLTLAAPGTALAHAPGVSASQTGAGGSLAEVILRASAWIENYCQQGTSADRSLVALGRTEKWGMPGRRALLDVDGALVMRPGHFPVQSVASLSIMLPSGVIQGVDVSLAQITGEGRLIEAPLVFTGGAPVAILPTALSRAGRQWVIVTFFPGAQAAAFRHGDSAGRPFMRAIRAFVPNTFRFLAQGENGYVGGCFMGCSPDHPAAAQAARGRAGPSRKVFPVLVGSDTPYEFPAGSENPRALAVGSVKYTGGFVAGAVPYDVQQACIWMVSELLSARRNPSGVATVKQGTSELVARPWRDVTGDSILLVQAKAALSAWRSW
jgi:hypothetical protein